MQKLRVSVRMANVIGFYQHIKAVLVHGWTSHIDSDNIFDRGWNFVISCSMFVNM